MIAAITLTDDPQNIYLIFKYGVILISVNDEDGHLQNLNINANLLLHFCITNAY